MKRFIVLTSLMLSVSAFAAYDYAITSGYLWDLNLTGNQTLLMTGGGGDIFEGRDNSILDIRNTSSPVIRGESGIASLSILNSSTLYFSGGCVGLLDVHSNSTAVLSGGQIGQILGYYHFPANPEHITVLCQTGWTYQNSYLSGQWLDNSAFNIKLVTQSGYSDLFSNMTIIPEPATLLLLAAGGLLLKRK